MKYDCIIIGKGPAGITTAIYLKRYGYQPLVLAKDGGALLKVKDIENYYGFSHITGPELLDLGIKQAQNLGIEIYTEEVLEIAKEEDFLVKTDKDTYHAQTVVLACGTSRNRFFMADQYEGVSYCATCDGFFYRKKRVALIGNGHYMAHELEVLQNICKEVIVFTNGLPLETEISQGIEVVLDKIEAVHGDLKITSILAGGKEYPIEGCFIAIGQASGFTLAKHLGLGLKGNNIMVDENLMTNIDGLFSCGDAVGGLLQVSKAVGEGASCATAVTNFLRMHKS